MNKVFDFFFPIKVGHTVAIRSSKKIKAWTITGSVIDITIMEDGEKIYLVEFLGEKWTEWFFRDEIDKVLSWF